MSVTNKNMDINMSWIFLNKGNDEYITGFAHGCNTTVTDMANFDYDASTDPLVLRGILKHKLMKQCWQDQRDFYYIDSGYFGNQVSNINPNGYKLWHRVVKNNIQHNEIVPRPADRFEMFKKKFQPWNKSGSNILIAVPDEKPCKFYGIDLESWIEQTVSTIKQHTDRPVVIRQRATQRIDRVMNNTLESALNDVFALVTFNSNAAVESVFHGIPVFPLAPVSAANPVGNSDLSKIETPYYPDSDKLHAWACHLAYGQFHVRELRNGTAKRILEETI